MTLYEKIIAIYPDLAGKDFAPEGTIIIQNDGQEDYIVSWSNKKPQPTSAQLEAIGA